VQKFLSKIFTYEKQEPEEIVERDYGPIERTPKEEDTMHRIPYQDIYRGKRKKEDIKVIVTARPYKIEHLNENPTRDATFPSKRDTSIRKRVMNNAPKVTTFQAKLHNPLYQPQPDEKFGSMVKRHRRMRQWRTDQLLKRLGILNLPKTFISSIEDYGLIPDPQIVERLAYVLGASRKEFIRAAYKQLLEKEDNAKV
jgi:ribosome-binding protein aMBF1 (putative translation factor)